jgi:hypothetical protein
VELFLGRNKNVNSLFPTPDRRPWSRRIHWQLDLDGHCVSHNVASGFDLRHRATVSGLTIIRECFNPDQNLRAKIQNSLSNSSNRGLGFVRWKAVSYW